MPVIKPKVSKTPKATQDTKLEKQQRRQQLMAQAEQLSRENPGLHPQQAYEILLGRYSLEEWKASREAKLQAQKALDEDSRSEEERAWSLPFFDAPEREPVWIETSSCNQIARIKQVKTFRLVVTFPNGRYWDYDKRAFSSLCSARLANQILTMRQIAPGARRDALPAQKPADRWPFPEETFAGWVNQRVEVQLLNGSIWTGFLRWNSRYTFLLGAEPTGDLEILIFKHACCGVQLAGLTQAVTIDH